MVIPLFPLNIVVYPGEELNLHIFEERYKQLIHDCIEQNMAFGIPSFVENEMEYGTTVNILSIEKTYPDGRMDIKTRGQDVFRVVDYNNPGKDVLYATGEAAFINQDMTFSEETKSRFLRLCTEFFSALQLNATIALADDTSAYDIAHKVGFTLEQEYQFLQLEQEELRMAFIIQHLENSLPTVRRIEAVKRKVKMNGHFKHFDPLKF